MEFLRRFGFSLYFHHSFVTFFGVMRSLCLWLLDSEGYLRHFWKLGYPDLCFTFSSKFGFVFLN